MTLKRQLVCLFSLLAISNLSQAKISGKYTKADLYEKFPQLNSTDNDPCLNALSNLLIWMKTNTT